MRKALHLICLTALIALSGCARSEPTCGDLLARIGHKPAAIEYQSCEIEKDKQGTPSTALYRVKGSHAAEVEKYLSTQFNMPALKRSCCRWDAPNGSYADEKTGYSYTITMLSDDTSVSERENWPQIPYFHILVSSYSEFP
ncbi:DUF4952 domain-containing protein [Pseudomonas sp. 5P_3.1_Bac2]|uniref:DUF4952 domain-containing protein n=1 Tax=Pseudomonas sp. 5P_3.1_Bac2 TaxID=2971617 RepID=UPI0021C94978|nr:DUF4952 domain-containing protein [Pseudomonas sp. 5P_3.1_Bac2]MCU1719540.1 DUF4952 domain-containing protein [Pseudomonas sp. 5P_3.1_Bac2]